MKILFCLSSLQTGGAERVAGLLASQWVEAGHEVVLMPTYVGSGAQGSFNIDTRIEVKPIRSLTWTDAKWWAKMRALRKEIADGGYDVVCSFLTNVNVLALVAAWGTGVPVVVSERTYPPAYDIGPRLTLARRLLYPTAARIVMQTAEALAWLRGAIPRARGAVLPNPIRFPLSENSPTRLVSAFVAADRKLLLAVGRLSEEKRFGWLIEQFSSVAQSNADWDLVILGDGPERASLLAAIRSAGMANRIKLAGATGNLDTWLRRADAFVLVSRFEGYPNALAEAVCYGLAALAIDCPTGPAELVCDGVNGVLLQRRARDSDLRRGLQRVMSEAYPGKIGAAECLRTSANPAAIAARWIEIFASVRAAGSVR